MDMAMDTGDTVEQTEEVYSQILGEIGMSLDSEMQAGKGQIQKEAASNASLAKVIIYVA